MDRWVDGLRGALGRWRQQSALNGDVARALRDWRGATMALQAHVRFDPERYQRQRIYRDDELEIVLLCWDRGQATPIHDHDGQAGWFTVLDGTLEVQEFERMGGPADLGSVGLDAGLAPGSVRLRPQETCRVRTGLTVCEAAAPETIHRVGSDGGRAVSLHVYARPLDSFLIFDENDGSCRRVGLAR
jgi:cysteine dioxygenase